MIASSLKIMLWDKEIGRLSWDARRGVSFFEYNPAFLGGVLDPFPLVASVKSPASRRPIMPEQGKLACNRWYRLERGRGY